MDLRPPFPVDFRLFLASRSPRRHSLLADIGVPYEVVSSAAQEVTAGDTAIALATMNARAKVLRVVLPPGRWEGAFTLGTDTVVTIDGQVMGKPASRAEAASMLTALSGRTHQVISGVALRRIGDEAEAGAAHTPAAAHAPPRNRGGVESSRPAAKGRDQLYVAAATTDVTFLHLDEQRLEAYLASGEWTDKAGAYAVQGLAATFVSEIRGEYSNVVGLPLCLLTDLFLEAGFDLLRRQWI